MTTGTHVSFMRQLQVAQEHIVQSYGCGYACAAVDHEWAWFTNQMLAIRSIEIIPRIIMEPAV